MLLVQLSLLCINSRNLINMEINQSGMQIHAKEFNFASCSTNPFQVPNVFYTLKTPTPLHHNRLSLERLHPLCISFVCSPFLKKVETDVLLETKFQQMTTIFFPVFQVLIFSEA